jgi:hypothetical protein
VQSQVDRIVPWVALGGTQIILLHRKGIKYLPSDDPSKKAETSCLAPRTRATRLERGLDGEERRDIQRREERDQENRNDSKKEIIIIIISFSISFRIHHHQSPYMVVSNKRALPPPPPKSIPAQINQNPSPPTRDR